MKNFVQQVEPFYLASRFSERLKGLLFAKPGDEAILLIPCKSVHTFGMHYELDIAFIDAAGNVMASYRHVGPSRRLRKSTATAVLERFSSAERPWFEEGDKLTLTLNSMHWDQLTKDK